GGGSRYPTRPTPRRPAAGTVACHRLRVRSGFRSSGRVLIFSSSLTPWGFLVRVAVAIGSHFQVGVGIHPYGAWRVGGRAAMHQRSVCIVDCASSYVLA